MQVPHLQTLALLSLPSPMDHLHEGWLFRSSHYTENYLMSRAQQGGFFCILKTIMKLSPVCQSVSQSLAWTYIMMDSFREQRGLSFKDLKLVWGFVHRRDQVEESQESLQCYIWVLTWSPKIFILESQHPHKQIRAYHPADATFCPLSDIWDSWGRWVWSPQWKGTGGDAGCEGRHEEKES